MFLDKIRFKKKKQLGTADDTVEFWGEFTKEGLNYYATYEEIKSAVIKEIVKRLEDDIEMRVEALKPEIVESLKENAKKDL